MIHVYQPPSGLLLAAPFIIEGRAEREVNRVFVLEPERGASYTFEFVQNADAADSLASKLQVRSLSKLLRICDLNGGKRFLSA